MSMCGNARGRARLNSRALRLPSPEALYCIYRAYITTTVDIDGVLGGGGAAPFSSSPPFWVLGGLHALHP